MNTTTQRNNQWTENAGRRQQECTYISLETCANDEFSKKVPLDAERVTLTNAKYTIDKAFYRPKRFVYSFHTLRL
jgi:hypothetical protein